MITHRRKNEVAWGSAALAILLFLIDLRFPRGESPAALFVAIVGASLWLPGMGATLIAAFACTFLTVVASFFSPPGPIDVDIFNRSFAILAIWVVACFCALYKRTEQRTLELAAIVQSSADAILRTDLHDVITSWNAGAEHLFGYSAREIIGKPATVLLPPELREKGSRVFETSRQGKQIAQLETFCCRKDGSRVPVALSVSPILDARGRIVGIATIARDLTEHKRAAEAQLAREAAEASSRAKSEFLASMSHEIRTPMNGVIGMLDLTLGTELQPEQRHYLEQARASADLLLRVINDILDFSKIEAGRLDLEPAEFSLRESLGETIKGFGPQAHRKGLELALHVQTDVPDRLVGDAFRLVQVLTNLVGNAIKFTDRGEVIVHAGVESLKSDQACLHISVTDTGPGIPRQKQAMIFGAFVQADSSMARRFGGTGLGLAISSRLVELMGGKIWVESDVGKGSVFHFTACFALQSAAASTAKAERVDLEDLPVLAADDNETNRHILAEMLENWRMKPTVASGGRQALEELKKAAAAGQPYRLVLLDALMPDMDGFSVAQEIKHDPALADATIMMLSSLDGAGELKRCRDLGITVYLRKPIKQSELLDAILTSLGALASKPEPMSAPFPSAEMPRPLHILVAEDNEFNQNVVGSFLKKWGHTVAIAPSGKAALAALEKESFDLILMDVQMPEMDGFATTQAIREKEKATHAHIPIIALTAHAMKGDRDRCIAAGMDTYVPKPIRAAELYSVIAGLLASASPLAKPSLADADAPSQVFDRTAALANIGGDRQLLREMTAWFLRDSAKLLADLRDAAQRGDGQALANAAHQLKSQAGSFAAQNAYRLAAQVEQSAMAGDPAASAGAVAELTAAVGQLAEALRYLESSSSASTD